MPVPLIKVAGVRKAVLLLPMAALLLSLLLSLLTGRAGAQSGSGSQQEVSHANPNAKKTAFAVEPQNQGNASVRASATATGRSAELRRDIEEYEREMARAEAERARAEEDSAIIARTKAEITPSGRALAVVALLVFAPSAVAILIQTLRHRSSRGQAAAAGALLALVEP